MLGVRPPISSAGRSARTAEMASLLEELVAIESPSTDPPAVARLRGADRARARGLGLTGELVPVTGGGPLLRARSARRARARR